MRIDTKILLGGLPVVLTLALLSGCIGGQGARDRNESRRPPGRMQSRPAPVPRAISDQQCIADLSARNVQFTPLPDRYYGSGCTTLGTVRLVSLASDSSRMEVTNLGPVTCSMSEGFAGWARFGVDRAARQILGSPVVKIETFGSYNCRNVAGTNRRSGHSTANAIDVSGFVLADGRRVTVLGDWSSGTADEREFLRVVHDSACKRFGTVLGPGYNSAHQNHFHLEATPGHFCR
ncbi:extensin family protein [Novosphingobium sp. 9]|uniref:extensin-like domain-containing protein n=1 Tax=Novosphingobium sp. 9 TaxID=2025349 RepID=UPI0021B5C030|nr:extensin family protein [Novosphingobium sp. 9]